MGLLGSVKKIGKGASGLVGGFTGYGGASAAGKAAGLQSRYLQQGIGALQSAYDDQKAMLDPQLQLGNKGLNAYANLLGVGTANGLPDYSGFQNSPGYQFQQQEGENALARMQSARGNYFSGGAGRELMRFNTGLADMTYKDYASRLGAFANLGPQTANLLSGYRGQLGENKANLLASIGDARASGKIGGANAYAGAAANWLNLAGNVLGGGGGGASTPASAYSPSAFNIGGSGGFTPGMFGF